jgi:hypothetical protein
MTMSESKTGGSADKFEKEDFAARDENATVNPAAPSRLAGSLTSAKPQGNGWEAYRRWLTRVQVPGSNRTPLDPSLYTWKGYRSWSDRVRRDWKADEQ